MARKKNPRACALPGKMSTRSRDLLPDRAFGLPKERKYPVYRMARDGTLVPSGSHASNAKARAQQEYDKGNLSAAKLRQIDRKADRVLKQCGTKGKKRKKNPDVQQLEENPNRLTVTADSEEEAERKARKFGRVLHTERIGPRKYAVSVRSSRRNNPEPMTAAALVGRLKF